MPIRFISGHTYTAGAATSPVQGFRETGGWPPLKGEMPAAGRRRGLLNQIITEAAARQAELIK